jgi:hypothetical protein
MICKDITNIIRKYIDDMLMFERIQMIGVGIGDLLEASNAKEYRRLQIYTYCMDTILKLSYWEETYVQESRALIMRAEYLFTLWEDRNTLWGTNSEIPRALLFILKNSMYLTTIQIAKKYSENDSDFDLYSLDMHAALNVHARRRTYSPKPGLFIP